MMKLCLLVLLIAIMSTHAQESYVIHSDNVSGFTLLDEIYLAGEGRQITDVLFTPSGETLTFIETEVSFRDGEIHYYDFLLEEFVNDPNMVSKGLRLNYTNDGTQLIVGHELGDIDIYNTVTWELITTENVSGSSANINDGGGVRAIAVSPDDLFFAVTTNNSERIGDHAFYLANLSHESVFRVPTPEGSLAMGTVFHPTESIVAYGNLFFGREGQVHLIDLISQEELATCGMADVGSDDLVITPDGETLIYSAVDGIRLWNMQDCASSPDNWTILDEYDNDRFVQSLAIHSSEAILAVGYAVKNDGICCIGQISLWDLDTKRELIVINEIENDTFGTVFSLTFSPDGTMLASGGADGVVRLWGIPSGDE